MRRVGAVLLLLGCAVACGKSPAGNKIVGDDASTPSPDPDQTGDAARGDARDAGGPADVGSSGDTGDAADAAPVPVPLTRLQPCGLLGVGQPTAMDLSPDGRLAVFGNSIGGVTIFAMSGFSALRTITAHSSGVSAVAFSRDSASVASGDADGHVALWDIASGGGRWHVNGLRGPIQALAFSASGTLWALTPDGLVAMDTAAEGTHGAPAPGTAASAAAFSEDAATIALGQADGSFRLLRASDQSTLATVAAAHPGGVTALRISANGNRIASGGADGTVALWDPQGNLVRRIAKPGKRVTSVDLNADGSILIVGADSYAGVLRSDGSVLVEYIIFPQYARLSKDGAFLVQMTDVARVDLSPIDPQNPNRGGAWSDDFGSATFSPDGRLLAEAVSNVLQVWDTQTGERVRTLDANPWPFNSAGAIAFSPDGVNLGRNAGDDSIRVRRVSDDALVATYHGAKPSYSLVFSPDGQWLATPGPAAVALWRTSDGTNGPTGFVGRAGKPPTAVAFSSDGAALAVGDAGGGVSLWSFPSGALLGQFASLATAIDRIGFSPDGTRVMVSDFNGYMALHALDGTEVGDLPRAYSSSFSFSSDGQYLATVGAVDPLGTAAEDGIRLSSPATGLPVMRVGPAITGDFFGQLSVVAFAPTGHRLAVTGNSSARLFCLP